MLLALDGGHGVVDTEHLMVPRDDLTRAPGAAIVEEDEVLDKVQQAVLGEHPVEENLRVAAYTRSDKAATRRDLDMVLEYFPILKQRLTQQAGTLSGGEQQMLAISRALMLGPRLMLLDEPSFGLAPLIVQEIFRIMRRINAEAKVSMLLVEQNAALALELADHAYVLETGRVVMSGKSSVVKSDEAIRKSYLGY